jgi:hypothetical protein
MRIPPKKVKAVRVLFIAACTCLVLDADLMSKDRVAVVKGRYDDIEAVLSNYHIPYNVIKLADCEKSEVFHGFDSVFFPSGMEMPFEKTVNVYAFRTRIQSVSLRKGIRELDRYKIGTAIKKFVESGGSAYFSGYSFDYFNKAFNCISFHEGFPYMGMPGRIESTVFGDLFYFSMKKGITLYFDYSGWIAVKSCSGANVLSEGNYETPKGPRSGPMSFAVRRGDGEAVYSSYESTVASDFRRFNIYRIAGSRVLKAQEKKALSYGQDINIRIVDSIQTGETGRAYLLKLYPGENTIYWRTEGKPCQIDVLDSDGYIVQSIDGPEIDIEIDINAEKRSFYFFRAFPSTSQRYEMHSVVAAHGMRFFKNFYRILWGLIISGAIALIIVIRKIFFGTRYGGISRFS